MQKYIDPSLTETEPEVYFTAINDFVHISLNLGKMIPSDPFHTTEGGQSVVKRTWANAFNLYPDETQVKRNLTHV